MAMPAGKSQSNCRTRHRLRSDGSFAMGNGQPGSSVRLPRLPSATTANEKSSRLLGNYRSFFHAKTGQPAEAAVAFRMTRCYVPTLIGMEGANHAFPQIVTEAKSKMAHREGAHQHFNHLGAMAPGNATASLRQPANDFMLQVEPVSRAKIGGDPELLPLSCGGGGTPAGRSFRVSHFPVSVPGPTAPVHRT
ncbi:hypothetical protein CSOJ01_06053 [Colletotrichum sojae]|uniref:Uncharacterized protein n=1 Tax=Colletotrichum sojae TaxID=2175907 RepID=A0A8H6JDE4_9PEZI|nr:hypothetical protein CSOJ01_06053 [Colletotrichum sojae]